ncbi:Integrase, catalytic core [Gossypium australe]|uniref:Integrase, catalytic core n=1 Tax=Gossypium australe TaxID=47621 RepID=A0A5B6WLI6_9ROSI|nr:Integrase, catalytic core [Gossypium australe]
MLCMLKSKEGPVDWRSTKKVPSKPKQNQPRAPLPTKARRLGKTRQSQMLLEERANHASIAKDQAIQKQTIGLRQIQQINIARRRTMLKGDHEEQVFAVSCSAAKEKVTKGWLLDSGCTNHMTPDAAIFKSIDRSFKAKVKVGNGHFIKAEGKGDVLISTPSGNKLVSNVLLVPEIDRILLSIAQLLDKGYTVVFKGNECQISDPHGSKLILVTMADKSFVVDWTNNTNSTYTVSAEDSKLWHQRLRHANFRSMAKMIKVAQVFLKFKAEAETETGCKHKTIRSDNGAEYTSAQFQAICTEAGIKHQLTNVYTPQQNRVSERKNRSLLDMAKCLLFEKNMPRTMWAEAVNTVVYLQNRLSTKALARKTPFEAWFGFKPSLAHLKVFSCLCYAQVPSVKRDKLSKRAQPGVLVGYKSIKKGYRILDPSIKKIQVSRDVIFNEKACWNWENNQPEATSEELIAGQIEPEQVGPEMDFDDEPVRGTRPLADIYERAQVAIVEPTRFEEAEAHQGWKQAMADEMHMIEKNQT